MQHLHPPWTYKLPPRRHSSRTEFPGDLNTKSWDKLPHRARRVASYKHWGPMRTSEPFRLQQHHKSQRGDTHGEDSSPLRTPIITFTFIFTRGGRRRQSASSSTFKTASAGPQHTPSDPLHTPPTHVVRSIHRTTYFCEHRNCRRLCPTLLQVIVDPCRARGGISTSRPSIQPMRPQRK